MNNVMNLDEAIVGIVLSLCTPKKGASFEQIYKGLEEMIDGETPSRRYIFDLLGDLDVEGLVVAADGGGYRAFDLDDLAKDLGIWDLIEQL
jgi:hypothetical protein